MLTLPLASPAQAPPPPPPYQRTPEEHQRIHERIPGLEKTLQSLPAGDDLTAELREGKPSWVSQKGRLVRAYRSRVDGGVQAYALVIPDSYDGTGRCAWTWSCTAARTA